MKTATTQGRHVFCSPDCQERGPEWPGWQGLWQMVVKGKVDYVPVKTIDISPEVAHVLKCDHCGFYLDEVEYPYLTPDEAAREARRNDD